MKLSEKFYNPYLKAIFASRLFKIEKLLEDNNQRCIISWRFNYSKNNGFQIKWEERVSEADFLEIFNKSFGEFKRKTIYEKVRNFVSHYRYWERTTRKEGNLYTELKLEQFLSFSEEQEKSKTKIGDLYRFWSKIKNNEEPKYFWLKLFLFASSLLYKDEYERLKRDFLDWVKKILSDDSKEIEKTINEFEDLISIIRKPRKDFEDEIYWWSKWSTLHNDQLLTSKTNNDNLYTIGQKLVESNQKIENEQDKEKRKKLNETKKTLQKRFEQKREQQFDFDLLIKILEQNENNDFNWKIRPICEGRIKNNDLNKHFLRFNNKSFRCVRSDCEKFNKYTKEEEIKQFDYYLLNKKHHFLFKYKECIFRISLKNFSKLITFAIQQNNSHNWLELKNIFNLKEIISKITNFLSNLIENNQKKTKIVEDFINEFDIKKEKFQLSLENSDFEKLFHEKVFKKPKPESNVLKEQFIDQNAKTINWRFIWKNVLEDKINKTKIKLKNISGDYTDDSHYKNKEYSCWRFSNLFNERSELKIAQIKDSDSVKKDKQIKQKIALVNNELRQRSVIIANYLLRNNRYKKGSYSEQQSSEKYKNYQSCFEKILEIILSHNDKKQKNTDLNQCFQAHGFTNIKPQQFNLDPLYESSLNNIIKIKENVLEDLKNLPNLSNEKHEKIVEKWSNFIHSIFKIRANFPEAYQTQIIIEKTALNRYFSQSKNVNFIENLQNKIEKYFYDELKIDFFKLLKKKEITFIAFCYWQVINQIQNPKPIKEFNLEFLGQANDIITERQIALKCDDNKIIFQNIKTFNFAFLMRFNLLNKKEFKKCFDGDEKTINFENLKLRIENVFEKKWFLKKLDEIKFRNKNFFKFWNEIKEDNKYIKRKDLITTCLVNEQKNDRWKNVQRLYNEDKKVRNSLFHKPYFRYNNRPNYIINLWFEWMKNKINPQSKNHKRFNNKKY